MHLSLNENDFWLESYNCKAKQLIESRHVSTRGWAKRISKPEDEFTIARSSKEDFLKEIKAILLSTFVLSFLLYVLWCLILSFFLSFSLSLSLSLTRSLFLVAGFVLLLTFFSLFESNGEDAGWDEQQMKDRANHLIHGMSYTQILLKRNLWQDISYMSITEGFLFTLFLSLSLSPSLSFSLFASCSFSFLGPNCLSAVYGRNEWSIELQLRSLLLSSLSLSPSLPLSHCCHRLASPLASSFTALSAIRFVGVFGVRSPFIRLWGYRSSGSCSFTTTMAMDPSAGLSLNSVIWVNVPSDYSLSLSLFLSFSFSLSFGDPLTWSWFFPAAICLIPSRSLPSHQWHLWWNLQ